MSSHYDTSSLLFDHSKAKLRPRSRTYQLIIPLGITLVRLVGITLMIVLPPFHNLESQPISRKTENKILKEESNKTSPDPKNIFINININLVGKEEQKS